jgi:two-component system response regulator NreC
MSSSLSAMESGKKRAAGKPDADPRAEPSAVKQGGAGDKDGTAGAEKPITIVIADDHGVVRAGLRLLLEAETGFEVVAEAEDVPSTQRYVRARRPSVLVLDLNMPGGSSLASIPVLRKETPETQIVVLTMQDDPAFAREALKAGALGFVLKRSAEDELIEACRLAARGEPYINPQLGVRLAVEPPPGPPDGLTEEEVEILRLVALGHTNAEIGERLFLSGRTVETHRIRLQRKLNLGTRAELVRYVLDRGLLER